MQFKSEMNLIPLFLVENPCFFLSKNNLAGKVLNLSCCKYDAVLIPCLEVIKLEFIIRLKNAMIGCLHLILSVRLYSSFITSRPYILSCIITKPTKIL